MLGQAIDDVLSVSPDAEFAIKPSNGETWFVRVRGLTKIAPGAYRVDEQARVDGAWAKCRAAATVLSRELCTVEDAQRQVDAIIAENRAHYELKTRTRHLAERFDALGVPATVGVPGRIYLMDLDAVERLLDRVERYYVHASGRDASPTVAYERAREGEG